MQGKIVEDALGDTDGNAIANVEVQTIPTISNSIVSNSSGKFQVEVACDAKYYTLTASKMGYEDKMVRATANLTSINLVFTMSRDSSYNFVTVSVLDAANSEPLAGAQVTTAAVGATDRPTTNDSGTLSFPFPANTKGAIRMTVQKTGYGSLIGDYDVISGYFTKISGTGLASGTTGGITIQLQPSGSTGDAG
jgi:hypothetical protein